jgi:hypothetical protein
VWVSEDPSSSPHTPLDYPPLAMRESFEQVAAFVTTYVRTDGVIRPRITCAERCNEVGIEPIPAFPSAPSGQPGGADSTRSWDLPERATAL